MQKQFFQQAAFPRRRGFTLVEILIVVVILGILAAIVMPQFSHAGTDARAASTASQMQTMRQQLTLYCVQHNDQWPDLIAGQWAQMLERTDASGSSVAALTPYGPYLQSLPKNPLNNLSLVAAAPGAGVGYVFDATTGKLWATAADPSKYYNETTGAQQDAPPDAAPIQLNVSMQ